MDLDDGNTGGGTISSVTHYGHEAILDEVVLSVCIKLGYVVVNILLPRMPPWSGFWRARSRLV